VGLCAEIPGDEIVDISGNRLDGVAVNLPARAMKGHLWNGEVHADEKPSTMRPSTSRRRSL
jgi:hypothetical protein